MCVRRLPCLRESLSFVVVCLLRCVVLSPVWVAFCLLGPQLGMRLCCMLLVHVGCCSARSWCFAHTCMVLYCRCPCFALVVADYPSAHVVGLVSQLRGWVSGEGFSLWGCNICCVGTAVRVLLSAGCRLVCGWSSPGQHPDAQHFFLMVPPTGAPWRGARSWQPRAYYVCI